jgi:hypothetical protein
MTGRAAPRRRIQGLAVLAMVGLAGWALLTVLMGVSSVVDGVREVGYVTSPHPNEDPEPILFPDPYLQLATLLFLLWTIVTISVAPAAAVLGIVHLAQASAGWLRCTAFGVVAGGAPVAAMAILLTEDPYFGKTSYLTATTPGVAMTLVAVLAVPLAWWLLATRPARAQRPDLVVTASSR